MDNKIAGYNYEYLIIVNFKYLTFEIYSKQKETKSVSLITNLNFLISAFKEIYNQNDEIFESTWVFQSSKRLKTLLKKANQVFQNNNFILQLESELDIDRKIGGWNSHFNF